MSSHIHQDQEQVYDDQHRLAPEGYHEGEEEHYQYNFEHPQQYQDHPQQQQEVYEQQAQEGDDYYQQEQQQQTDAYHQQEQRHHLAEQPPWQPYQDHQEEEEEYVLRDVEIVQSEQKYDQNYNDNSQQQQHQEGEVEEFQDHEQQQPLHYGLEVHHGDRAAWTPPVDVGGAGGGADDPNHLEIDVEEEEFDNAAMEYYSPAHENIPEEERLAVVVEVAAATDDQTSAVARSEGGGAQQTGHEHTEGEQLRADGEPLVGLEGSRENSMNTENVSFGAVVDSETEHSHQESGDTTDRNDEGAATMTRSQGGRRVPPPVVRSTGPSQTKEGNPLSSPPPPTAGNSSTSSGKYQSPSPGPLPEKEKGPQQHRIVSTTKVASNSSAARQTPTLLQPAPISNITTTTPTPAGTSSSSSPPLSSYVVYTTSQPPLVVSPIVAVPDRQRGSQALEARQDYGTPVKQQPPRMLVKMVSPTMEGNTSVTSTPQRDPPPPVLMQHQVLSVNQDIKKSTQQPQPHYQQEQHSEPVLVRVAMMPVRSPVRVVQQHQQQNQNQYQQQPTLVHENGGRVEDYEYTNRRRAAGEEEEENANRGRWNGLRSPPRSSTAPSRSPRRSSPRRKKKNISSSTTRNSRPSMSPVREVDWSTPVTAGSPTTSKLPWSGGEPMLIRSERLGNTSQANNNSSSFRAAPLPPFQGEERNTNRDDMIIMTDGMAHHLLLDPASTRARYMEKVTPSASQPPREPSPSDNYRRSYISSPERDRSVVFPQGTPTCVSTKVDDGHEVSRPVCYISPSNMNAAAGVSGGAAARRGGGSRVEITMEPSLGANGGISSPAAPLPASQRASLVAFSTTPLYMQKL